MPRKLRIEYPGAIYHVMSHGDHREEIFKDDQDRKGFLSALGEACQKTDWQVHAYCLMPNHFHLVIETLDANLVSGMKWLLGVYTKRFNIRHKLCGHHTEIDHVSEWKKAKAKAKQIVDDPKQCCEQVTVHFECVGLWFWERPFGWCGKEETVR